MTRYLTKLGAKVGGIQNIPTHKALELGKGIDGLYVDGVPELVTGELSKWAEFAGVEAIRIPAYWMHKPASQLVMGEKARDDEKVIYFFHGGAYVSLSSHPSSSTSEIPRSIIAHTQSLRRSFAVEYRLTALGENPFPAQLLDALAGYSYLVNTVGFRPENIILVGDSAGANLALALTRYLISNSQAVKDLPSPPGGMVLLSPWCDLTGSHVVPGSSYYKNIPTDFLSPPPLTGPDFAPSTLAGPHGLDILKNEYISPAYKNLDATGLFKQFPPAFISAGDAEILLDSIVTLQERMVAGMGKEKVEILITKDAFHDFVGFLWFEPQRTQVVEAIGDWIERL
ncbi:hypothetical protein EW145_g5095 [Phellinidium pouzarii]|uniref:Alpha/beta hydrolase fold-3 domain-containing protein n=1 Tax=Phellinidium pouzarii TaxID=167371 RepID=A0A4V3XCA1_9AGAM|nr:hypothetical protein EW145_g5095 [Phellinidium pouzarii]